MDFIFGLIIISSCIASTVLASRRTRFIRYNNKRAFGVFLERTADSAIHCNAICTDIENCCAVNYQRSTGACQLSSVCSADLAQNENGWTAFFDTDVSTFKYQFGTSYTDSSGIIQSPNYPSNYLNNIEYAWVIWTPENNHVVLTFHDIEIEAHPTCSYDSIQVRDGYYTTDPLLGVYCGSTLPAIVKTCSATSMTILFRTDKSNVFKGFEISWVFQSSIGTCGCNYYNVQSGTIMSPNFPRDYFNNADCIWIIRTFNGPITMKFADFITEVNSDFVEVWDGAAGDSRLLGSFNGSTLPGQLTTTGNAMSIRFYTDGSVNFRGFKTIWQA